MESEVYRARIIARQALNNLKAPIKEKKVKEETIVAKTTEKKAEKKVETEVETKPETKTVKKVTKPVEVKAEHISSASKAILCYVGKKVVAEYDSLTKCATALGMTRPMVKNAIDNGTILENGFKLVFK